MKAMVGIAAQLDRHAVFDRHVHAARVGAIERADVFDDSQRRVDFNGCHGESFPICGRRVFEIDPGNNHYKRR